VHEGFFAFAGAMKQVDPRIRVCATWGRPLFARVARGHHYDCLTDHPVTSYRTQQWTRPREGHDLMMLDADRRVRDVAELEHALPAGVPLLLTEFSVLKGDWDAYPTWASSASQAVYMATEWASWLKLHVPVGTGGDLLWTTNHAVFGHPLSFTYSAEAVTRQAIKPMFNGGGRVLATSIFSNPMETAVPPARGRYAALVSVATRTPTGDLLVMVVNRLPTRAVLARIAVSGRAVQRTAWFRTVAGPSFTSANLDGRRPAVTLRLARVRAGSSGLVHRFPPASTTLVRLRPR
jgi:alpha-L-arabinofuranosidase